MRSLSQKTGCLPILNRSIPKGFRRKAWERHEDNLKIDGFEKKIKGKLKVVPQAKLFTLYANLRHNPFKFQRKIDYLKKC